MAINSQGQKLSHRFTHEIGHFHFFLFQKINGFLFAYNINLFLFPFFFRFVLFLNLSFLYKTALFSIGFEHLLLFWSLLYSKFIICIHRRRYTNYEFLSHFIYTRHFRMCLFVFWDLSSCLCLLFGLRPALFTEQCKKNYLFI